jgi:hypothetical protein
MVARGGISSKVAGSFAFAAIAIATCCFCAGCEGTVRSASATASSAAVPVIVDESLAAFEDPLNRERVEQILGSPEMQRAINETSKAFVQGAFEPGAESNAQIFAQRLTDSVAEALTRDIRDQIIPAAIYAARDAARDAMTPEAKRDLQRVIDTTVREATVAAVQAGSAEMERSLAPALRGAIVGSLNSPEMRAAVAGVVSDATRAALLSSRDVILELHEHDEYVGPVERIVSRIERLVVLGIVATFVIGSALGALIVHALRRRRGGGPVPPAPGARELPGPSIAPFDRSPTRAT